MEDTIVLYPSGARGHLAPMVEFAKLILTHHPNFSVSIIISHTPNQIESISSYITTVSAANSSIKFLHLPPILLPPDDNSPKDFPTLTFESTRLNNPNLRRALLDLSQSSKLIKAFVIDFFRNSAFEVAASLSIPTYYFLPCGANGLAAFLYSPTIHNRFDSTSLKDLDVSIDVPGLPSIPAHNMPMLLLVRNRKVYQYFIDTAIQMRKSAGLIVNTFQSLEHRAIDAILNGSCTPGESVPPIYCIGPLIGTGCETQAQFQRHPSLTWLDSQPSRSVVFLSFGSMGAGFRAEQLREIAIGLESSGVRFLWVARGLPPAPDDLTGSPGESTLESLLPAGFMDRTKERGMIVKSWIPQVLILNHESVGGFVTHCGWNSILEASCAGVPMLAWPLYAEQKVNRAFLVEEIKVAVSVAELRDGSVSGVNLKERLTELMESDKGRDMKERVVILRDEAIASYREEGSSVAALAQMAQSFKPI